MTRDLIIEKLTVIFREVFSDNAIRIIDSLSAKDVYNWDSLTHILMINKVEQEFDVKFSFKDLRNLKEVGDIIRFIEMNTE